MCMSFSFSSFLFLCLKRRWGECFFYFFFYDYLVVIFLVPFFDRHEWFPVKAFLWISQGIMLAPPHQAIIDFQVPILAALAALAIPLSISVVQSSYAQYSSYDVPVSFLKISKSEPKRVSSFLFFSLAFAFFAWLFMENHKSGGLFAWIVFLSTFVLFFFSLYKSWKQLDRAYKLVSGSSDLVPCYKKFISKSKNFRTSPSLVKDSVISAFHIGVFVGDDEVEIESGKRVLNDEYVRHVSLENNPNSRMFLLFYIQGYFSVLCSAKDKRNFNLYNKLVGGFSYRLHNLVHMGVVTSQDYIYFVNFLVESESEMPDRFRYFSKGRSFVDNFFLNVPANIKAVEVVAESYEIVCHKVSGFADGDFYSVYQSILSNYSLMSDHYRSEVLAFGVGANAWENGRSALVVVDQYIESGGEEFEWIDLLKKHFEVEKSIFKLDENVDSEKRLKDVIVSVFRARLRSRISHALLKVLSRMISSDESIYVKCRNIKNPPDTSVIELGESPLPSNISDIYSHLKALSFLDEMDLPFFHYSRKNLCILYSFAFVYEAWALLKKYGEVDEAVKVAGLPDQAHVTSLRDVNKLLSCSAFIKDEVQVFLAKGEIHFSDVFSTHPKFHGLVSQFFEEYWGMVFSWAESLKKDILENSRFSSEIGKRYFREIEDYFVSRFKRARSLEFSFKTSLGPYFQSIEYSRESFIDEGDVHSIFSNDGQAFSLVYEHLLCGILIKRGVSVSKAAPCFTANTQYLVLGRQALSYLIDNGFCLDRDGPALVDPSGVRKIEFEVAGGSERFLSVFSGEALLKADYSFSNIDGFPVRVKFYDNRKRINVVYEVYLGEA